MLWVTWHLLQLHQEQPCPPRLQEERIGGVLMRFLMYDLDETFSKSTFRYYEYSDTISSSIKNIHILQDSRKILGGQVESWWSSWCWIFMKLSGKLPGDIMSALTPSPAPSRTSMSSKTPGRDLEDRCSLGKVPDVGSWWNFQYSFPGILCVPWHYLQLHQEHPHPPRLQEETLRIGGVLMRFLLLDLNETFSKASLCILWLSSWCWILIKLSLKLPDILSTLHQEHPPPPKLEVW